MDFYIYKIMYISLTYFANREKMTKLLISVKRKKTCIRSSGIRRDVRRIINTPSAQISHIDPRFGSEETTIRSAFQQAAEMKMK